jgi:hypothetical protein
MTEGSDSFARVLGQCLINSLKDRMHCLRVQTFSERSEFCQTIVRVQGLDLFGRAWRVAESFSPRSIHPESEKKVKISSLGFWTF